jgi:hypothetical protein
VLESVELLTGIVGIGIVQMFPACRIWMKAKVATVDRVVRDHFTQGK